MTQPAAARRIAVWSGPRNISTAMMRSWGSRPDTYVTDEPLYAHYLAATALDHPGRDEVISTGEPDWRKAVGIITGPIPEGRSIWYQKHMSHHLLPEIGREWLDEVDNGFLIRDPREVLASYIQRRETVTLQDLGLREQVEIFELVRDRIGKPPPVVDARDVLSDPARLVPLFCEALGIEFLDDMLHWEAGPRATDGVWAKHWYDTVERSTGFTPYRSKENDLPAELEALAEECRPYYRQLHEQRLGQ